MIMYNQQTNESTNHQSLMVINKLYTSFLIIKYFCVTKLQITGTFSSNNQIRLNF